MLRLVRKLPIYPHNFSGSPKGDVKGLHYIQTYTHNFPFAVDRFRIMRVAAARGRSRLAKYHDTGAVDNPLHQRLIIYIQQIKEVQAWSDLLNYKDRKLSRPPGTHNCLPKVLQTVRIRDLLLHHDNASSHAAGTHIVIDSHLAVLADVLPEIKAVL
ncbi:hypothetical protein EVAR_3932_1 [Eumeta japonica]|uniref:Uncharacterized protein n=1 Tax=Eumeta variegata TaxID=151549 RepID=A0A4C1SRG8_EUMVA|nr:hypothetical protein EVAR_3932_1 [Eumeta japonica]